MKQIRQNLMELNRAVCLEYPERDIPWFHEKYCQELESLGNFQVFMIYFRPADCFFYSSMRTLIPIQSSNNDACNITFSTHILF